MRDADDADKDPLTENLVDHAKRAPPRRLPPSN